MELLSFLMRRTARVSAETLMERCLELARVGRGHTGVNPMVGSLIVRAGKIVSEGCHECFGKPHAERNTLNKILVHKDDVLYVNLEPCCHQGKTLPCTDAIIEAGVKHIVYGMKDPNTQVAGKGIEVLRAAGVDVQGPVLPGRCERLNRGYVSLQTKGRPWITVKCAKTRDGRIASDDGTPLRITSRKQDAWSHMNLRAMHDAILVGAGTVRRDNPQLTVRHKPTGSNKNLDQTSAQPIGLILNSTGNISPDATLIRPGTIIVTARGQDMSLLQDKGVRVFEVATQNGLFVWEELWRVLTTPSEDFNGITSILVEGGPKTWESFRNAGMVDEEVILIGQ